MTFLGQSFVDIAYDRDSEKIVGIQKTTGSGTVVLFCED